MSLKTMASRLHLKYRRRRHGNLYWWLRDFTMIPEHIFNANLDLAKRFAAVPGAIVECGTWKGGMIAGMSAVLGKRDYYLFDSFEGLPPAQDIDGEAALNWQRDTASEKDAHRAMQKAGADSYFLVKGWFNQTLPTANIPGGIAILRMDADWYDSTMEILNSLFHQVNEGGVLLIDDYHTWDGCSRAVHDFLSSNKRTERISEHEGVCYIVKKAP